MSYNASKHLYCVYNTETHEYMGEGETFGYFKDCRLFTSPVHIKNSLKTKDDMDIFQHNLRLGEVIREIPEPRYPKLESGKLQIREIEITKWMAKEPIQ